MNNLDSFIYKNIQKFRSKTNLGVFNLLTNNNDLVNICPNLYLGNYKSSQNPNLLLKYNIQSIVNCTKDIPFHDYFKNKTFFRIDIEDSKEYNNVEDFKSKIIDAAIFIDKQIKENKNVIVHCFWGLMRSPTVIAAYLIYRYNMDVEGAIEMLKDKKNLSFHNIYNFKEILEYVKKELDKNAL